MEELLLKMYQYLVRYGTIEVDNESKSDGYYHRTTVYSADEDLWLVTLFNGQIMGIKRFK
jgi:hypothetical protein